MTIEVSTVYITTQLRFPAVSRGSVDVDALSQLSGHGESPQPWWAKRKALGSGTLSAMETGAKPPSAWLISSYFGKNRSF
jgi:hypothetical protein